MHQGKQNLIILAVPVEKQQNPLNPIRIIDEVDVIFSQLLLRGHVNLVIVAVVRNWDKFRFYLMNVHR